MTEDQLTEMARVSLFVWMHGGAPGNVTLHPCGGREQ